ncbi:MAG: hypothetical protein KDB25_09305 [Leucobacter sp.]|nr:hypothetical protein [Thermoleophilia bacterium]MCB1274569.1 hypothetical protein [Leucobacter sp.]
MLVRLMIGLVAWMLMMIPRPNPIPKRPVPTPGEEPPRPGRPDAPPTPPPGYDGEWPPHSSHPDAPPTPPPGHHGEWPPSKDDRGQSLRDRLQQIWQQVHDLLQQHDHGIARAGASDAVQLLDHAASTDSGGTADA